MMFILFFIAYQCIQIILIPGIIVFILWRLFKRKQTFGCVKDRLGWVTRNTGAQSVWIQAVSMGETLAAESIIKDLAANKHQIYLTGSTAGAAHVSKNFHATHRAYLPFDFLPSILLAFWRIKPKALIIIEGDWWPNLVMVAKIFSIPVYGLNARVTPHTGWRKMFFNFMCRMVIRHVTQIFVQTEADAQAFVANSIPQDKLQVLGNIKAYNVTVKVADRQLVKQPQPFPVIMAGSIHPGEATIFLDTYGALKKEFSNLKLIIVPRHLHWISELTTMAANQGNIFILRNRPDTAFATTLAEHDIIIGGAMGIMFDLYAYASLFYLGGTFVTVGGHNLLEPAVWGVSSIVGPYHINCADTLDNLKKCGAGFIARSQKELYQQSKALLSDTANLAALGTAAENWLAQDAQVCKAGLQSFYRQANLES